MRSLNTVGVSVAGLLSAPVAAALAVALLSAHASAGWIRQDSGVTAHLYAVNSSHSDIDITWVCGENGMILFTSNGGETWTQQDSGTNATLYGLAYQEANNTVLAVGENGVLLRTTNLGANWVTLPTGTTNTLRDVSEFAFFACGDGGVILRSTDEGANWISAQNDDTRVLYAITGAFARHAVGEGGVQLLGSGNGATWSVLSSATQTDLHALPLFNSRILLVGDNGLVLRSTNGGVTYAAIPTGTDADLRGIEYSINNTSRAYVVGETGTILKTTDSGATWLHQNSGATDNLHDVFFYLDDAHGWAVGDNGTILRTNDAGGGAVDVEAESGDVVDGTFGAEIELLGPNPVRDTARFALRVEKPGAVRVRVFDAGGRLVSDLTDRVLAVGEHRLSWNASAAPAGVYLVRLDAPGSRQRVKLLRLR